MDRSVGVSPKSARRRRRAAAVLAGLLLLALPMLADPQQRPAQPFAPEWSMLAGWDVFAKKGCGTCHALRGIGGGVGPDLGRIHGGRSFFELGATMWNHLPRMGARMRAMGIERPKFTPRELSDLIALLFTAQYYDESGDATAGEKLYAIKGCAQCHEVGGRGGRIGPGLDFLKRANSPVLVAAAMWNHAPEMADAMQAKGITRPTFQGRELLDVISYVVAVAKTVDGDSVQVIPGTPDRGQKLFAEKHCIVCHAVSGKGGNVGPHLGRLDHHMSLTGFAALMWNHGPAMWAEMRERAIQVPRLTGQEMADIVAYLYTSHYFDDRGDARRGRELVQSKGCLTCHSVRGKGGRVSADFATSFVVGSAPTLVAAMWNHSGFMEAQTQKQRVPWPVVSGPELADIAAYLGSLSKPGSAK